MQLATGTVVNGKVVLEGASFPDGTIVTILARESDETFEVPAGLESELQASLEEANRGETINAAEWFERLRHIG